MNLSTLGEFGLIARLHQSLTQRPGVRLGLGDDAAILEELSAPIVTCDALIENIHFRLDWTTLRDLGWKAMAVNISDIAAMGGIPVAAFVTLAVPRDFTVEQIEQLYAGMEEAATAFDFTIAGGDTTKSPGPLFLSITLIGNAPQPVLRSGAKVGDILMVTGTLGNSAAGLEALQNSSAAPPQLLQRHFRPTPRLHEMKAALTIENAIHAALDLSDGLTGDGGHIARSSDVTLEIETALLPVSNDCRVMAQDTDQDALSWALSGGEDYELLLCVAPDKVENVRSSIEHYGTQCTVIGRVVSRESAPVMLLYDGARKPAQGGFAHF